MGGMVDLGGRGRGRLVGCGGRRKERERVERLMALEDGRWCFLGSTTWEIVGRSPSRIVSYDCLVSSIEFGLRGT